MAKLNNVFLYGMIDDDPNIITDAETGKKMSAITYVHVVRGYRDDHTDKPYMKHDRVLVVSLEEKIIEEIATWKPYDIVNIKGIIATKTMDKKSHCSHCHEENKARGILTYVVPIMAQKECHCETKEEALTKVIHAREISDQAIIFGTLIKPPSYFKTKAGTVIAQYQIALNRKYRVRTDDPKIKTDWPWVKSYGEQAIEDRMRLGVGSEVFIDGVIQSRRVTRNTKCPHCNEIYSWADQTSEIVPYAVEYMTGYKSDDDLEAEKGMKAAEIRASFLSFENKDVIEADALSEDIDDASIDGKEQLLATSISESD